MTTKLTNKALTTALAVLAAPVLTNATGWTASTGAIYDTIVHQGGVATPPVAIEFYMIGEQYVIANNETPMTITQQQNDDLIAYYDSAPNWD